MERSIAWDEGSPDDIAVAEADERLAFARLVAATDRQMMISAPMREAINWKLQQLPLDGGRSTWNMAIEADEQRHGMGRKS